MIPQTTLRSLTRKIGSGATPRGGSTVYRTGGVSFIRSQNVLDNRMKIEDVARLAADAAHELRGVTVEAGDVLLNITGDSIARCCLVDEAILPARVSQHVAIIRTNDQMDPRFLQRALVNPAMKESLLGMSSGGTRNALTKAMIEELVVPCPDLPIQRAIAEVLGALDDKITANTALVESIDGLAAVLTRSALSDDAETLASIAQVTMGSSPPGTSYNTSGKGMVFYQGVTDFGVRTPSNRMWTDTPVRTVEQGDILVSVRAPVGRINIASEPTCAGRGLAGVRSLSGRNHTLFHLLRDIPEAWQPFEAEGTIFGSISKPQLLGVRVPTVRPDLVDGLEEELQSLENRVIAAIGEDVKLSELRDALLPALMSGRLRVKDAERIAEGEV